MVCILHEPSRSEENTINVFISMDISLQLHQQLNIHEASWMQVNEKTALTGKL